MMNKAMTDMNTTRRLAQAPGAYAAALLCVALVAGCGKTDQAPKANPSGGAPAAVETYPAVQALAESVQSLDAAATAPTCSVEGLVLAGAATADAAKEARYNVPLQAKVKLIGFATHKPREEALGSFQLLLVGAEKVFAVSGKTDLERPDVAAYFKAPAMLKSGFQVNAALQDVPAGSYRMILRGSQGTVCPTHHTLVISP